MKRANKKAVPKLSRSHRLGAFTRRRLGNVSSVVTLPAKIATSIKTSGKEFKSGFSKQS